MKQFAAVALAIAALLAVTSTTLATGTNKLTKPSVSPLSGSTTTTFTFSVDYSGDDAAASVRAVAGSLTVTLSLVPGGTATAGTWRASRSLPAGSWTFVFEATAAGPPTNPTATAPTVTVTGPTPRPTPTPPPTPRPTAPPPPTPTPTPAGSPRASSTASASSTATAVGSVSPAPLGSSASGGSSSSSPAGGGLGGGDVDQQLGRILTGGLVAIGLLAVVGFAAIWRDRRRREEELVLAPAPSAAPIPTADPRPLAEWERDFGLEDEPIGTIEYQPPGDEG
jgi:hypothetical protein